MALYLKNCYLAFLCLYRSKSYGIRKGVVTHPKGKRAGEKSPPSPVRRAFSPIRFIKKTLYNVFYPPESCPAYVRLQAVTALGAKYPRSLNAVLWLASLAVTVRGTNERNVGTVILSKAKSLLPLGVGRSPAILRDRLSPPQAPDQDDVHPRSFPRCKSQVLNTAIDLIRERLLIISFRSAKVRIKGLAYRNHSLKDGSRPVCVPSYIKPKRLLGIACFACAVPLIGLTQVDENAYDEAPFVIYGEIHSPFGYKSIEALLFENYLWHNPDKLDHLADSIVLRKPTMLQGNPKSTYFRWTSPPIKGPAYFTLKSDTHYLLQDFMVFPGDSVMIFFDDFSKHIYFSGKSAAVFQLQTGQIHKEKQRKYETGLVINQPNAEEFIEKGGFTPLLEEFGSEYGRTFEVIPYDPFLGIKKLRESISSLNEITLPEGLPEDLQIEKTKLELINANRLGQSLYTVYNNFRYALASASSKNDSILLDSLNRFYGVELPNPATLQFPQNTIYYGSHLHKAIVEYALITGTLNKTSVKEWIKGNFEGPDMDKILGYYLISSTAHLTNTGQVFAEELPYVETPWIASLLEDYVQKEVQFEKLNSMEFSTPENSYVTLSDLSAKGKLLLLDFWYTGCGACVKFYRDILSGLEAEFSHDITIVSISTDRDKETWMRSIESGKYTSDEALNFYAGPDHEILRTFQISAFPRPILLASDLKAIQTGGFPQTFEGWQELLKKKLEKTDNTR
jgi:thiol-disulfide isomerase/thioredoxin